MWIVIGSLASVLSFGAPNLLRLLFLTPAVACVLALGFDEIWKSARGRIRQAGASALVGLLVLWFAAGETTRYFRDWSSSPGTYENFNTNFVELAAWLRDHPDRPAVVVFPRYLLDTPTIAFETDRIRGRIADDAWQPNGERAWLVAPLPPYPPLNVDEQAKSDATTLKRFTMGDGAAWAVVLEVQSTGTDLHPSPAEQH